MTPAQTATTTRPIEDVTEIARPDAGDDGHHSGSSFAAGESGGE